MYIPAHFRKDDPELLFQFMVSHPFATLISSQDNAPLITHLPFIMEKQADGTVVLLSHLARANPHWKSWVANPKAMVIFQGPHAYISPSHYTSLQNVPTWNFIAVHATGAVRVVSEAETLPIIEQMIETYDQAYMQQYSGLDARYREGLLKGIVAFRIEVEKLEGKFKLSQNKPAKDRSNIIEYFEKSHDSQEREIAEYMKRTSLTE